MLIGIGETAKRGTVLSYARGNLALVAFSAFALALVGFAVAGTASRANAASVSCVSPIASCGCTITKPGFYVLANDLSSSQGLTSRNGCIDIQASKVVLNAGKPTLTGQFNGAFNITGGGGTTPSGIGIHILKGSGNNFIELATNRVEGWDVGILVQGDGNIVEDFQAASFSTTLPNGTAGVEIDGGQGNNINDFSVGSNKNYGIWIRGASNNQINCSNTNNNGNIGVYIGCSPNGPINGNCSPSVSPSTHNRIFDHSANSNTKYGVLIDLGNTGNVVTDVQAHQNGTTDLLDENPNCDQNRWFFLSFGTASPSCIPLD
jgi:hypothetical protein